MEYPASVYQQLEALSTQVDERFGGLKEAQLNWRPSPDQWSIGLCLRHLITTNQTYFPVLDQIATGTFTPSIWSKIPGASTYFGKMILKMVSPETRHQKGKSPKAFTPIVDAVEADIVSQFLVHQQALLGKLKAVEEADHRKLMITSPAAFFLTYSLYDTLHILAAHEARHMLQAVEVLEKADFPHISHA